MMKKKQKQSECSNYNDYKNGGSMTKNSKKSYLNGARPAFSMFEIAVVLVVMTGIILLAGRIFIGNRQREYDAKYNKIAAVLSANIAKDLMDNTGFEYADYLRTKAGNGYFRTAAIRNVVLVGDGTCDGCVIGRTNIEGYPELNNPDYWDNYEETDGTVIAIRNDNTPNADGTYSDDIIIDTNGENGPNEVGKDIRIYEQQSGCDSDKAPAKPNDKYLYTFNNKTCEWVKGDCDPAKMTGKNATLAALGTGYVTETTTADCEYQYHCVMGAANLSHKSHKPNPEKLIEIEGPREGNNCQYRYKSESNECPAPQDGVKGYSAKYHASSRIVENGPSTYPECKYSYYCNPNDDYREIVGSPDTTKYPISKFSSKLDDKETIKNKIEDAKLENNCTNKYGSVYIYDCIKSAIEEKDAVTGDYAKKQVGNRVTETPKTLEEGSVSNNCVRTIGYTYECKSDKIKNTKVVYVDKNTNVDKAKDKDEKAIEDLIKGYNSNDYSRVTKNIPTAPNKQTADVGNNCENIYEYSFYCEESNINNIAINKTDKYKNYSRVQETPEVEQAAAVANNCERKTSYTYSCKSTDNKYEDDSSKMASFDSSIIKETKSTATSPKVTASVDNNCVNIYVNSYTYACIPEKVQNTETGKNATYAGYSNVKETAVVRQSATVANNCKKITEYTYACIPEKIKNTETGKTDAYKNNSNVKEEKTLTQEASIANNCENKYTYEYSCKTTTDTNIGYNKKYSDNAAKQDSIITETKVITQEATLANNCENKYEYEYNCKKEDTTNTGYNATYSAYAAKENSMVVESITNTQKATLDNNCKSKNKYEYNCLEGENNRTFRKNINSDVARTTQTPKLNNECLYKYACYTNTSNKTYDKNKHNNANMIETAPTEENDCRYIYTCKTGADNSTYNAKYHNDPNYTVEATPTMANNCTYAYTNNQCPVNSGEKYYIVWRGAGAAHRSLKNMLEEAGNRNLAAKISTDMSFYKEKSGFIIRDKNTMKEICSSMDTDPWSVFLTPSNQTESKQEVYVSKINQKCGTNYTVESFSRKLHENLVYPEEDVRAYILNSNGTVVDTIPASYDSSASINSDFGKYRGSSITGTKNYDNMSGTLYINGCPYDIEGKYRLASPLVLDLKGNGFKFTSVKDGIDFDLDADGNVDETAWTAKQNEFDDAFLVLDKDGDGQVNSGSELFGDQNGEDNGFLELSKYDDNGDGKIDKHDKAYHQLHLWADMNGDGKVDHPQEWKTLAEMGITEISTGYNKVLDQDGNARTDKYGNDTSLTGSFKRVVEDVVDGVKTFAEKVGTMIDVFFQMVSGLFGGK